MTRKTLKIISWNVNGIRAVVRKGALQALIRKEQPDILCLQETKAMCGQVEIDLPEYEEYWNSAEKKGYSGTAIFSKEKPLSVSFGIDGVKPGKLKDAYGDAQKEGRVTTLEFPDVYVVTVYTPNAKDDLTRLGFRKRHWDPAFLQYCKSLEKEKPVVFCGDLNVAHTEDDLARPKENEGKKGFTKDERAGFQRLLDAGFVDTFRLFTKGNGHYTWWSPWAQARERNVGWRVG